MFNCRVAFAFRVVRRSRAERPRRRVYAGLVALGADRALGDKRGSLQENTGPYELVMVYAGEWDGQIERQGK